jgi:hypothetical protein
MSCQQVQMNLSLYLYGELDFAQEEELEQHLSECALCQRALAREKTWHTTLNSERLDVPLDLLSQCRRELRGAISSSEERSRRRISTRMFWTRWLSPLGFSATRWSMRVAVASFLLVVGFAAARWIDRNSVSDVAAGESYDLSSLAGPTALIREIQPRENNRVRILFDQVRPREITGRPDDSEVRELLLAAMKDPSDPGIRVDSVEMLKGQEGSDVRDALIYSVRHDTNAAVRLKALEGLRRFTNDHAARDTVKFVLEHDEDPGVRSEAIDVLAPANQQVQFSPDLAGTLQQIVRSEREDDYIRLRSMQLLREMKASLDAY